MQVCRHRGAGGPAPPCRRAKMPISGRTVSAGAAGARGGPARARRTSRRWVYVGDYVVDTSTGRSRRGLHLTGAERVPRCAGRWGQRAGQRVQGQGSEPVWPVAAHACSRSTGPHLVVVRRVCRGLGPRLQGRDVDGASGRRILPGLQPRQSSAAAVAVACRPSPVAQPQAMEDCAAAPHGPPSRPRISRPTANSRARTVGYVRTGPSSAAQYTGQARVPQRATMAGTMGSPEQGQPSGTAALLLRRSAMAS